MSEERINLDNHFNVQGNIQAPFTNNENIQINPNPNEISSPFQSQNNTENITNQPNNIYIPPPFSNNPNFSNNPQQNIEVNQNMNGQFQNNGISNNYNTPYINPQINSQTNLQPNNNIRVQPKKSQCCGKYDVLAVCIGCVLGAVFIYVFPFIYTSLQ